MPYNHLGKEQEEYMLSKLLALGGRYRYEETSSCDICLTVVLRVCPTCKIAKTVPLC